MGRPYKIKGPARGRLVARLANVKRGDLTKFAERFGVSPSCITHMRRKAGYAPLGPGRPEGKQEKTLIRERAAKRFRRAGKLYREIGKSLSVTTQRAHQLVHA